jgi:hypothetical protein
VVDGQTFLQWKLLMNHPTNCRDFGMEAWKVSWEDLIFEVGERLFLFNDVQQFQILRVITQNSLI